MKELLELVKKLKKGFLMQPHPLTNFEIQKYCQNKPRFNGVYSRDNLFRMKDWAYAINLYEYSDIEYSDILILGCFVRTK